MARPGSALVPQSSQVAGAHHVPAPGERAGGTTGTAECFPKGPGRRPAAAVPMPPLVRPHLLLGRVGELVLAPAVVALLDAGVVPQGLDGADILMLEGGHLLHVHLPDQERIGLRGRAGERPRARQGPRSHQKARDGPSLSLAGLGSILQATQSGPLTVSCNHVSENHEAALQCGSSEQGPKTKVSQWRCLQGAGRPGFDSLLRGGEGMAWGTSTRGTHTLQTRDLQEGSAAPSTMAHDSRTDGRGARSGRTAPALTASRDTGRQEAQTQGVATSGTARSAQLQTQFLPCLASLFRPKNAYQTPSRAGTTPGAKDGVRPPSRRT